MAASAGRAGRPGRPWRALQGDLVEVRDLAQWLRDQIDLAGLTLRALEGSKHVPYSRDVISRMLTGRQRPEWEFVQAIVVACTAADAQAQRILLAQAEKRWKAADPATARPYLLPATPGSPAASKELAVALAEQHRDQAQRQVERNQQVINALMYMMGQFHTAMATLTRERDTLREQTHRQHAALQDAERELQRLRNVEHRLQMAEESRAQAEAQFAEAHQHLSRAQYLRSQATIQLLQARHDADQPSIDGLSPVHHDPPDLMGEADQQAARTLLDNVQQVLDESAEDLDRLQDELTHPPAQTTGIQPTTTPDNAPTSIDNPDSFRGEVSPASISEDLNRKLEDADRYRMLAASDRRYRASLAATLTNIGISLNQAGRYAEVLEVDHEVVALYRETAADDPAHRPRLALALINLAISLGRVGADNERLACELEAVGLYRALAAEQPVHQINLAAALADLGITEYRLDYIDESLKTQREAVTFYRAIAADDSAYQPHLAVALANLGTMQHRVGRYAESLGTHREAATLMRAVAASDPTYQPQLADALTNLGISLGMVGQHTERLEVDREAVSTWRTLAERSPSLYQQRYRDSHSALQHRLIRVSEETAGSQDLA